MESYLNTTIDIYKKAAESPNVGLCCTTSPIWAFPGLSIPRKMIDMNYGCGSTVHPRDLENEPRVLYVGVGGGMELLQFSYFSRKAGSVVGVDIVDEMLTACEKNLEEAATENEWFEKEYINLRKGNALHLPIEDSTIDVAAQNCLFNIFSETDLIKALGEMYRVLKPHGKLILSDPVCNDFIPEHLRKNEKLRALCLSGAIPLQEYLDLLADIGFGTIEIRARYPYRVLSKEEYDIEENIFIESVEICAIKDPVPSDGVCVFTGRSAIYHGTESYFDDHEGHILMNNQPLSVCDKTALNLEKLNRSDLLITPSTYHYNGGGCC